MVKNPGTIIFELRCVKCNQLMRYDHDVYVSSGFMEWACWTCHLEVVTSDVLDCLLHMKKGEIDES